MEKESWYGNNMSPIDRCGSPESMYCTGKCRDNPISEEGMSADVVGVLQRSNVYHTSKLMANRLYI